MPYKCKKCGYILDPHEDHVVHGRSCPECGYFQTPQQEDTVSFISFCIRPSTLALVVVFALVISSIHFGPREYVYSKKVVIDFDYDKYSINRMVLYSENRQLSSAARPKPISEKDTLKIKYELIVQDLSNRGSIELQDDSFSGIKNSFLSYMAKHHKDICDQHPMLVNNLSDMTGVVFSDNQQGLRAVIDYSDYQFKSFFVESDISKLIRMALMMSLIVFLIILVTTTKAGRSSRCVRTEIATRTSSSTSTTRRTV